MPSHTGGSVGSSDIQELGRFVTGGTRLLLFGGSGTSSFVTGVNSYLLTTGSTSYSWVSVGADKPAMTVWHEDHPLNKNLPPLINQTDLANVNYVTQVRELLRDCLQLMMWVVFNYSYLYPGLSVNMCSASSMQHFIFPDFILTTSCRCYCAYAAIPPGVIVHTTIPTK